MAPDLWDILYNAQFFFRKAGLFGGGTACNMFVLMICCNVELESGLISVYKPFWIFYSLQNLITRMFNSRFYIPISFIQCRVHDPLKIPLQKATPPGGITDAGVISVGKCTTRASISNVLYLTSIQKRYPFKA
jgi:hypothetical protein